MASLLKTRRWQSFTLLTIVVIVAFGLLSHWQWSRAEQKKSEANALIEQSSLPPIDFFSIADPGSPVPENLNWRSVSIAGSYSGQQVLVRKRPMDARNGFWVAAQLSTTQGAVWINRGWIPAVNNASTAVDVPPTPTGNIQITGRLRTTEHLPVPTPTDLPAGQTAALDTMALGSPYDAYIELVTSQPPQTGLTTIPLPEVDSSRNVSYALQWMLFALIAIGGWFFFLRREAKETEEAQKSTSAPAA